MSNTVDRGRRARPQAEWGMIVVLGETQFYLL